MVFGLAAALLLASCGGADRSEDGQPADAVDDAPSSASADDAVVLEPGGVSEGTVTIDGIEIDYVAVTPDGFEPGDRAPVMLAFPPGGQDLGLTRLVVDGNYRDEAVARGWVVISPAAPDGVLFFQGSEALVPGLMDWVERWVEPESDRFHLVGVSNGGISSFRAAAAQPERVASILVFPGFPRGDADRAALDRLVDIPIRLHVGADDGGWVEAAEETAASLESAGGDVELFVYPGVGHRVDPLSGGEVIFDQLDAVRP